MIRLGKERRDFLLGLEQKDVAKFLYNIHLLADGIDPESDYYVFGNGSGSLEFTFLGNDTILSYYGHDLTMEWRIMGDGRVRGFFTYMGCSLEGQDCMKILKEINKSFHFKLPKNAK